LRLRSPSLFWRTLALVLLLIVASLAAWLQSFRVFERAPRAQTVAQQVVSIVNITRAALLYSDPFVRRDLLAELAANEGIRIYPLEPTDDVQALPESAADENRAGSGRAETRPGTRMASTVNGSTGLWVSLDIDEDRYWVVIDRDPVARTYGTQWTGWAVVALLLSVIGAVIITRLINKPLAQLSRAASELGSGRQPAPLPEAGPAEIRTVNQSFNRMVADLGKLEADRAVLLAGISHDLRTPLARLRLELEMTQRSATRHGAPSSPTSSRSIRSSASSSITRAPRRRRPAVDIDLTALVEAATRRHAHRGAPNATLDLLLAKAVHLHGYRTELDRALDNLLTNALRYGRDTGSGRLADHGLARCSTARTR
jgi:two-component system, OmpR family, osmolarity sensor histidine kinase EnvZ